MSVRIPACVGCGYCCSKAPCALGMSRGAHTAPCKFLRRQHGRYRCHLVLRVPEFSAAGTQVRQALAIGAGCSSNLCNSVREDQIMKDHVKRRRTFFEWMRYRRYSPDLVGRFCLRAFTDLNWPRHTNAQSALQRYVDAHYSSLQVPLFEDAWEEYLQHTRRLLKHVPEPYHA